MLSPVVTVGASFPANVAAAAAISHHHQVQQHIVVTTAHDPYQQQPQPPQPPLPQYTSLAQQQQQPDPASSPASAVSAPGAYPFLQPQRAAFPNGHEHQHQHHRGGVRTGAVLNTWEAAKVYNSMSQYNSNPVGALQERFQSRGIMPNYRMVKADGASHCPTFAFQVFVMEFVAMGK